MSNEELAVLIKAGERDRLLELWDQVKDLIAWHAVRRYHATEGLGGVEVDDLIQSGYIAMVNAVEDFDPRAGYQFSTYLGIHLKTAFSEAGGYRSSRQYRDPLHGCDSLDRPIGDEDGDTIGDLQAAPGDLIEDVEHRIWGEQLRDVLERAVAELPERKRVILERRFYQEETYRQIGRDVGLSADRVRQHERKALRELHRNRRLNGIGQFWEEHAIDLKTPWYLHVGPSSFNSTHTSAVEKIVLQRERDREHMENLDEFIAAVEKDLERDRAELARMMAART